MGIDEFKLNLRRFMKEKNLNAEQLSKISGVCSYSVHSYLRENTYRGLQAYTLERLAEALGVTMDELWGRKN